MQIGPNRVAVVGEVLHGIDPTNQGRREFAEGREHEVVGSQRHRAADLRGLLPFEPGIDRELALTLEGDAFAVQPPGQQHPAQDPAQGGHVEADIGIADRRSVGGQDLQGLGATPVFGYLGHFRAPSSDAESIGDGGRR